MHSSESAHAVQVPSAAAAGRRPFEQRRERAHRRRGARAVCGTTQRPAAPASPLSVPQPALHAAAQLSQPPGHSLMSPWYSWQRSHSPVSALHCMLQGQRQGRRGRQGVSVAGDSTAPPARLGEHGCHLLPETTRATRCLYRPALPLPSFPASPRPALAHQSFRGHISQRPARGYTPRPRSSRASPSQSPQVRQ